MKKIATAIAISAIALAFVPASANGRTVEGSILAPAPKAPAVEEGAEPTLLSRHARCAYLLGGADSNGVFGHVVEISDSEWDAAFTLSADAGDPDVLFYADLGGCDAPGPTATDNTSYIFEGDESGTIPEDTTHAIIVNSGAANATFTLTIG